MKCHYMILILVCGVLRVQLLLPGLFFPRETRIHNDMLHCILKLFVLPVLLQENHAILHQDSAKAHRAKHYVRF